ncbi:hypothetical protein Poli38472_011658 [Pythium oligandrum]|uniref:Eukaryotic translation initiation factor 3 subunit M n=1 Tax=Pythium oligandrum TaxID=41045 RepID=A0A8K1CLZ8_PYTOL|nr:hypothetical protein Poli38472_011658 [Pythium oligandrum]|eukprot:TMW64778.1 hypothetical protein Poli38472_011658 [Pythium oligandrum]
MGVSAATTATDLVAYVNKLLAQSVDLTQEIKKGEWPAVVAAVAAKTDALLALEVETDVEGTFNMLFDVIRQLPADSVATEAKKVLAVVTSKTDDKAVLRLRIASNLFNKTAGFPELRFDTLLAVITYASSIKHLDLVSGYFDDVENLFDATKLTADKRRKLYLTIADVLAAEDEKSVKVLLFLEKYLNTLAVEDAAAGKDIAVRAVKLVAKNPVASFLARVDLITNPAVSALKGDKSVELLQILSSKTLKEFAEFKKAAGDAFFTEIGADAAELESTMRLFTLCSLPTGFDEIPFEKIAGALSIDDEDVEKWVVKAITANLINAKVDQLRRTVVITRSLQRSFGEAQWNEIHAKLQVYKKNVGALLDVVRNARQAHQK